jgi:hypothetical protein
LENEKKKKKSSVLGNASSHKAPANQKFPWPAAAAAQWEDIKTSPVNINNVKLS